jgi:UDP-N-acetylglucosamine 2-epimerase (non-hydrolysing)
MGRGGALVKIFPPLASRAPWRQGPRAELGGSLSQYRIGLIIGTRPEAIKLAPVAHELARAGIAPTLYLTGQHPGLEPADHGLDGYRAIPLGQPGLPDPIEHAERVAHGLERLWSGSAPSLVMVQGDTSSAMGGATAAAVLALPLAHVEAGLRTHDLSQPWPEEGFRIEIDRLADLLFAPTATSAANLRNEMTAGEIHVTGNSGIDALLGEIEGLRRGRRPAKRKPLKLLVTCHRRESWGAGLASLATALASLAAGQVAVIDVVLHPNPRVSEAMYALLNGLDGIRLVPPLSHRAMIEAMLGANLLLSDSGGVQEEAPALGIPLLVLRDKTERPEGVEHGAMVLVGTDGKRIGKAVRDFAAGQSLLSGMARPMFPFGDGRAAPRIVAATIGWLERRRPVSLIA